MFCYIYIILYIYIYYIIYIWIQIFLKKVLYQIIPQLSEDWIHRVRAGALRPIMSYIAFPIGHRLLIRLFVGRKPPVIAHISIDMSSPLAQLAKKKQYQANSSILLIGLQKVHQITKNNTQHGGFTRIYSPKFS